MPSNLNDVNWYQAVAYVLFAAFGGLMGYLMRALDRGLKITFTRALIESVSAGFMGALVTLACMAMDLDPLWSGVIVGVCGWLGATASIRVLEGIIYKKFGWPTREEAARGDTNDQPASPRI